MELPGRVHEARRRAPRHGVLIRLDNWADARGRNDHLRVVHGSLIFSPSVVDTDELPLLMVVRSLNAARGCQPKPFSCCILAMRSLARELIYKISATLTRTHSSTVTNLTCSGGSTLPFISTVTGRRKPPSFSHVSQSFTSALPPGGTFVLLNFG